MNDVERSLPFIGYIPPHFFFFSSETGLLWLIPCPHFLPCQYCQTLIGRCDADDLIDRSILFCV